jgi:ATP-dependent RNA helicase DHX29
MADQQTPELLRLSLQDLAIRVKICKLGGIEETLSEALDPPLPKNIRRAVDALIDVRALTPGEDLTPLGIQLARLPLDVFLGKLILLGSIFKCLDAVITIAAILSSKSPFVAPFGARNQADTIRQSYRRGMYHFHKAPRIFHCSSPQSSGFRHPFSYSVSEINTNQL